MLAFCSCLKGKGQTPARCLSAVSDISSDLTFGDLGGKKEGGWIWRKTGLLSTKLYSCLHNQAMILLKVFFLLLLLVVVGGGAVVVLNQIKNIQHDM